MSQEIHYTHHHRHHHHHQMDASEIEKNHRLSASKRRKILGKITLYFTIALAIIISAWVAWAYL